MAVLGRGSGPDATSWELDMSGDVDDLRTMVNITLADGRTPWGIGCGGPARYPGKRINVCTGSSDDAPSAFIARVTSEVRAVVVTMSDGAREDLLLHGDAARLGARIAVLVYQPELDIHRVDLLGKDGTMLPHEE